MKKQFRKALSIVLCCIMVLSCSVPAFAATPVVDSYETAEPRATVTRYDFVLEANQSSVRDSFYYDASLGTVATFRLKATGTSDCYFRCEITTTSIATPTVIIPNVLGNDPSGEAITVSRLTSGWYQLVIIPENGSTHGNDISFRLTLTQGFS